MYLSEGKICKPDHVTSSSFFVKNLPAALPPLPHTSLNLGREIKKYFGKIT